MKATITAKNQIIKDTRGRLAISTLSEHFPTKRFFIIDHVPIGESRGNHAHKTCTQILYCTAGSIDVLLDNGINKQLIQLDCESEALVIPPGIWNHLKFTQSDSQLLVLSDEDFSEAEYIRDYQVFLEWINK